MIYPYEVSNLDIDKLDLLHKLFLVLGPKVDQKIVKSLLALTTILADRDTGDELKQLVRKI
jgi:hypothetical protein